MEKLYTVEQVAAAFGVTRAAVYTWMKEGLLPYVMLGKRRRVRESDIQTFVRPIYVQPVNSVSQEV